MNKAKLKCLHKRKLGFGTCLPGKKTQTKLIAWINKKINYIQDFTTFYYQCI